MEGTAAGWGAMGSTLSGETTTSFLWIQLFCRNRQKFPEAEKEKIVRLLRFEGINGEP